MTDPNSYSLAFGVSLGGTSACAENGKITATTEHGDEVMWLDLTDQIVGELRDIDRRYNYGDAQALREALDLMRRHGAEWRHVRSADWWLEGFEENIRNYWEDYDEDMRDFEVFRSSFSMYYDGVQNGAEEEPGDEYPSEAALRRLWNQLRAEDEEERDA